VSGSRLLTVEHSDPDARVLVVTNMWPHDDNPGYGIFIKRQVDSLIAAGLRCDVVFVRGYRSQWAFGRAAAKLAAANFRGRRYELVHAHSGETAFAARFFARAPVLVSYCGDDLLGTPRADGSIPLAHRARRWIVRQQARMQTATLTKSREMEGVLPRPVQPRNSVVPNGVDRAAFAPIDRAEARRQLGWGDDERVALFAADPAVERKRHWLAEAACEIAATELDGVRLHVAYPSPPEEMPVLMSAADCLLLTSTIEGSPNVVKEALMCDLPVIATPSGDVRELLDGVVPSWVCDSDPAELGAALVECLREPRRSNGREASEWLGSERIAARVLELYERLAPGSAS
jgi:teichuronic acid biosynthesis glycosyltransferase TuaC